MNTFRLLQTIIVLLLAIPYDTTDVKLKTRQGFIYGRKTEKSIEYLGYVEFYSAESIVIYLPIESNMLT